MEFSRQVYWSGLPFPPPEDLPDPGIEPVSPALAGRFITIEQKTKTHLTLVNHPLAKAGRKKKKERFHWLILLTKDSPPLSFASLCVSLVLSFIGQGLSEVSLSETTSFSKLGRTLTDACRDTPPFPLPVPKGTESQVLWLVPPGPAAHPSGQRKGSVNRRVKCWLDKSNGQLLLVFFLLCWKVKIRTHWSNSFVILVRQDRCFLALCIPAAWSVSASPTLSSPEWPSHSA